MNRRRLVLLFVSVLLAAGLPLLSGENEFDRSVDFSVTLENLDLIISGEIPFDPEKIVILEGSVASVTILDKNPDSFLAIVELVKGKWLGTTDIRVFKCYIQFEGPPFAPMLSGRPVEDPALIALNSRVLVAGRLGIVETEDGRLLPFLSAVHARTL